MLNIRPVCVMEKLCLSCHDVGTEGLNDRRAAGSIPDEVNF
jgi:hypothetical protein